MRPKTYSSRRVAELTGVTYRQLDYWIRTGLIHASVASARGSGSLRRFNDDDLRCVFVMKRGLDLGINVQRLRNAMSFVRQPEGCRWLLVGESAAVPAADDSESIVDAVRAIGSCLIVDMTVTVVPEVAMT